MSLPVPAHYLPERAEPGSLLAELKRVGLTLTDMAHALGMSVDTASRWNRGRTRPEDPHQVADWLLAVGVDPARALAIATQETPVTTPTPPDADARVTNLDEARRKRGLPVPAHTTEEEETPMEITSREDLSLEELAHYHLDEDPFEDLDNPEDIWLPPHIQRVEKIIFKTIQGRRILVMTGAPGAGKSTILRRIYVQAQREKRVRLVAPASLNRRRISHAALAVAILRDLTGQDTSSMAQEKRSELLRSTLEDADRNGLRPAVLIDEAHQLKPEAIVALKHIWDSHTLFRQLAMILVGQPPLRATLKANRAVREFTGRARLIELPPLSTATADYLRWRFSRVGGDADQVFTPAAYQALGVRAEFPLWVNNLAVLAMRAAARVGDRMVDAQHVGRA